MSLIGQEAEHLCHWCACVFSAPLGRTWNQNYFCSAECRIQRTRARDKDRDARRRRIPEYVARRRLDNRRWHESKRNAGVGSAWSLGAPAVGDRLSCVELEVSYGPMPKYPVSLQTMRGVHGAVSALLGDTVGVHHLKRLPTFATRIHDAKSLRVVVWDEACRSLYGHRFNGVLWDRPTTFTVEDVVDVSAPTAFIKRGRTKVRLTTITPVTISKDGHTRIEVRPCSTTVQRSLAGEFLFRVGAPIRPEHVMAELLDVRTEPSHTRIGGKFGTVSGWSGEVDLVVNAPALWLLRVAEKVGFGARVAFGFGRIAVEEIDG